MPLNKIVCAFIEALGVFTSSCFAVSMACSDNGVDPGAFCVVYTKASAMAGDKANEFRYMSPLLLR